MISTPELRPPLYQDTVSTHSVSIGPFYSLSLGIASKSSKYLSAKSRTSSIENQLTRPSSAAASYQVRRGSAPKDVSRQGSTPSTSGRSTPVHRTSLGSGGGREGTDGGVASTQRGAGSGLPPRTPYRYCIVGQGKQFSTYSSYQEKYTKM